MSDGVRHTVVKNVMPYSYFFFSITANTGLWIVSAILISTKKYSKSYSFIIKVVSKTFSITIMALTRPPVMKLISLLDKCCYTQET